MAKHQDRKKPSPSFSNFSDSNPLLSYSFKPYRISCSAYSVARVTLPEAEEIAHKMLQWYPEVWIDTPNGMHINVGDGTAIDFNELAKAV